MCKILKLRTNKSRALADMLGSSMGKRGHHVKNSKDFATEMAFRNGFSFD